MAARIVLLTPARRFIANRFGLGYQIPLGLVLLGGPLVDAGHAVRLIDNDLYGWSLSRLADEIRAFRADYVLPLRARRVSTGLIASPSHRYAPGTACARSIARAGSVVLLPFHAMRTK